MTDELDSSVCVNEKNAESYDALMIERQIFQIRKMTHQGMKISWRIDLEFEAQEKNIPCWKYFSHAYSMKDQNIKSYLYVILINRLTFFYDKCTAAQIK